MCHYQGRVGHRVVSVWLTVVTWGTALGGVPGQWIPLLVYGGILEPRGLCRVLAEPVVPRELRWTTTKPAGALKPEDF